jgi:hypothetical protein
MRSSRVWRPATLNWSITEHWMAECSWWSTDRLGKTSHGLKPEQPNPQVLTIALGRRARQDSSRRAGSGLVGRRLRRWCTCARCAPLGEQSAEVADVAPVCEWRPDGWLRTGGDVRVGTRGPRRSPRSRGQYGGLRLRNRPRVAATVGAAVAKGLGPVLLVRFRRGGSAVVSE